MYRLTMYRLTMMLSLLIMGLVCLNGCADSATATNQTTVQPEYTYQIGDTVRHKSGQVAVVIDSQRRVATWDCHGFYSVWKAQDKDPLVAWYYISYITAEDKFHKWFAEYELERGPE